jgi:hypothetical protein
MSKKLLFGLMVISLLFLTLFQTGQCEIQSSLTNGWQIEDKGGFVTETNNIFRLWSNGGSDCPSISLYKQIKPNTDFTFSVQVNAQTPESCGIFVKSDLPIAGNFAGFNFEYGHYGEGLFLLARNSTIYTGGQDIWGVSSRWTTNQVAYGDPSVWYTMQLRVSSSPFRITTSVFDENGTSIGTVSTSDIDNFTFEDIKYIGLSVWGYSPADYLFRNIEDSFDNPARISITTQSSSTTIGSTVNVLGTLSDCKGVPLQNKTVVLSYTFQGVNSWIPISSGFTDEQGKYNIQWINSASGTFTLRTEWKGDSTFNGASNTTSLSFFPIQNQQVFFFESNSTVYALAFNNETSTLSFNVTGPTGTTGYVKTSIPKSLQTNGENLKVYLDGKQLNYSVTNFGDSWVFTFNYSHSTHEINLHLETNASPTQPLVNEVILIAVVALFGTVIAIESKYWLGRKEKGPARKLGTN